MELNKIFMVGNLTKDPELRYTGGGTAVCDLRLASNRRYRRGGDSGEMVDETCYVDVVVWGRSGENCNQYLKKGSMVLVEGRLKLDEWEKEGQRRSKHSIVADRVNFFPRGAGGEGGGGQQSYGRNFNDDLPGESGSNVEEFNSEVPF